ncbi:TonB-dependent receptor [Porticoccus sp. W117]|uniref:TonB-dependent receptor n=1 Tax=Porticoccus sp. W117 TaxID=3054777 RepID=UPI002594231C|nr:TonB-dependent receptor [Porticoccus sp. W117]MDM3870740.1 TonB-dependent receptor [Porticoccus sp. W117]
MNKTHRFLLVLSLCVAVFGGFFTLPVAASLQADSATKDYVFDIPRLRADKALVRFARQADVTFLFPVREIKKLKVGPLQGRYTLSEGLRILLANTGIVYRAASDKNQKEGGKEMKTINKKLLPTVISLSVAGSLGVTAASATAEEKAAVDEELVVVGSRAPGRSAQDLPVPVDVLNSDTLEATGQTEVGRMLQAVAPSFNFPSSSISDGTDALRPATLRGLGPDQTLVLINGKRRHQAGLIHINTSVGRGTAGTDMNAIPGASIKRIEVLRDGAAAQYGSDAIAGVINIVLNDDPEAGSVSISQGQYTEGDGDTTNFDLNKGFAFGDGGFVDFSFNYRDRGYTNRAGLHGSCQFPGCVDTDGDGILEPGDPREVTVPRQTFRIGDAESEQLAFTLNAAHPLGGGEAYGFVTYSTRDNESAAFFRHNGNTGGNAPLADGDATIPEGFLPKINSEIDDLSFNIGYRIEFSDESNLDVSYTTGENTIDYVTSNSLNSSFANAQRFTSGMSSDEIRSSVPRSAMAYGLELSLDTFNVDYTKAFGNLFMALGAEFRTDEYRIIPGEEYAFRDFDTVDGVSLFAEDRSGGIQGFPGIGPQSAVDESRDVFSVYADFEYDFDEAATVSAAARYDDYDGFGSTVNFKLAGNVGLTDNVRLRGAVSTGFRAPSMQQLFFNNVSTQFVTDVDDVDNDGDTTELIAQEVGTFRNDSSLAQAIGIPALEEEESDNFSLGVVANISDGVSLTVDYYSIDIDNRIVISNRLGSGLSAALDAALIQAGAGAGQFFLNGADTETDGVDIVLTYNDLELAEGSLDLTFAANFTDTEVVDLFTPVGSGLETVSTDVVFNAQDISIIEEWQPEDRISANANWTRDAWTVNLSLNRYGEYTVTDGGRQTYGAEILTDLRIAYEFENGMTVSFNGNNIFDVTPDINLIGNSRTGAIEDGPNGDLIVDSRGVFQFSRRSAPFGFNGAFYSLGVSYDFN